MEEAPKSETSEQILKNVEEEIAQETFRELFEEIFNTVLSAYKNTNSPEAVYEGELKQGVLRRRIIIGKGDQEPEPKYGKLVLRRNIADDQGIISQENLILTNEDLPKIEFVQTIKDRKNIDVPEPHINDDTSVARALKLKTELKIMQRLAVGQK